MRVAQRTAVPATGILRPRKAEAAAAVKAGETKAGEDQPGQKK